MAGPLTPITQLDFSGGVNAVANPFDLTRRQVQRIRNFILSEHGALMTRDGYAVLTTSPTTTEPLLYRGIFINVAGTQRPFAIQKIGAVNRLWRTDTDPWTNIADFTTQYTIPQAVTMTDREIVAPGYETPKYFTGAALTAITSTAGQTTPTGAKHLAFHLGSLWLWNTNGSTTTLDGPSSLRMSDVNNMDSWPNANQTFISKDDGQEGMGLAQYTIVETGISPTQTLIAFKNYSTYQITGVFGGSTFAVQKIKSDMGCIAPRTIQFISGFGIVRLTHKGFALYNGVEDRLISEPIRPYLFGSSEIGITGLDMTEVLRGWAAQSQNPPLYVCALPTSGTALDRVFVYDLVRRTWTICDFPIKFNCLNLFATPTTMPIIHAGRDTSGQLVSLFAGATDDAGAAINWSVRTKPEFLGSPMRMAFWRRLVVDLFFTPTQSVTAQLTVFGLADPASSTLSFAAIPGVTGVQDGRRSLDVMRTAGAVYAELTGTGHVHLRGLEWQGRPKPLTKVAA